MSKFQRRLNLFGALAVTAFAGCGAVDRSVAVSAGPGLAPGGAAPSLGQPTEMPIPADMIEPGNAASTDGLVLIDGTVSAAGGHTITWESQRRMEAAALAVSETYGVDWELAAIQLAKDPLVCASGTDLLTEPEWWTEMIATAGEAPKEEFLKLSQMPRFVPGTPINVGRKPTLLCNGKLAFYDDEAHGLYDAPEGGAELEGIDISEVAPNIPSEAEWEADRALREELMSP